MNKFRILTTDNEWVYSQVEVLGNRIVCPLCNEQGAQFLKPNLEFRPETFSECTYHSNDDGIMIFGGDIMQVREMRYTITMEDACWMGTYFKRDKVEGVKRRLTLLTNILSFPIIGNIHQNPELLEEK